MLPAAFCGLEMPQEKLKHMPQTADPLHPCSEWYQGIASGHRSVKG